MNLDKIKTVNQKRKDTITIKFGVGVTPLWPWVEIG